MFKRFLFSFLLILLYMALYSGVILFYMFVVRGGLKESAQLIADILVFGGAFVFYFPWFIWSTKVAWFFKSDKEPVPLEKLRSELLVVNTLNGPFSAIEEGENLRITWKYLDAKWWEFFAKVQATQSYELLIKFDDNKKEVRLIDITRSMNASKGWDHLHFGFSYFRGVVMEFEIGAQWGIKENLDLGTIYNYRYSPSTIKTPVMNTILKNGWNIRFALF